MSNTDPSPPGSSDPLPQLHTFLRRTPGEMGQQVITLWTAIGKLGQTTTTAAPGATAPATPEAPELDEAYRWVLSTFQKIGQGSSYTSIEIQTSQDREAALLRCQASLSDMGQGIVDSMGLCRAGLYAIRVRTDSAVAQILASPGPHYSLAASWSLVEEAEARPLKEAQKTRARTAKTQDPLNQLLARSATDGASRQALERLLQVAGVASPATPRTGATNFALAPAPRSGRRGAATTETRSTRRRGRP